MKRPFITRRFHDSKISFLLSSLRYFQRSGRFAQSALALLALQFASLAWATSYTTTTFTDFPVPGVDAAGKITSGTGTGQVTIRSAIMASNNAGGSNTINLQNGTYTLTQGPYDDEFNFGAAFRSRAIWISSTCKLSANQGWSP